MTEKLKTGFFFQGDKAIWVIFFFLCIISLIEVFSAASTLAYKSGSFMMPLFKQALFLSIGTFVVLGVHNIPCRMFKAIPIIGWPVCIILLILTLAIASATNGASRWLFGFQPSELAKGVLVSAVAFVLAVMQREDGADKRAFKIILWLTLPICGLIFSENLSTACLLFGVVIVMMFIGRVPFIQLGKLLGVLAVIAVVGILSLKALPNDTSHPIYKTSLFHRTLTWKNRIEAHSNNDKVISPMEFDIDKDAQVAHANIAIASSKGVGKMPGNSVERDFLSQAFSDFIFAIIIEEMGIAGAVFVVFLYIVLLFRAGRIASRCERNFPAFLVMGLALLLVSQALLNMMVAVGLFPVTGQPLPLISRGGTSTLINCFYIGMILSVSRYARKADNATKTPGVIAETDGLIADNENAEEFRKDEGLV